MKARKDWPQWAQDHFPETHHQAVGFEQMEWHYAMHMTFLVVAATRIEGAWAAYGGPVPGMRHDQEHEGPLHTGDKLSEDVARVMFPHLDFLPYDR
ncbi:MAG: hypothetical protein DRQ48_00175 [Gammaproteobacteria bacterium]|nr:MAG: hypothetical protein DRQ48_00175 [Gammaproteobacteria bacterium]